MAAAVRAGAPLPHIPFRLRTIYTYELILFQPLPFVKMDTAGMPPKANGLPLPLCSADGPFNFALLLRLNFSHKKQFVLQNGVDNIWKSCYSDLVVYSLQMPKLYCIALHCPALSGAGTFFILFPLFLAQTPGA